MCRGTAAAAGLVLLRRGELDGRLRRAGGTVRARLRPRLRTRTRPRTRPRTRHRLHRPRPAADRAPRAPRTDRERLVAIRTGIKTTRTPYTSPLMILI